MVFATNVDALGGYFEPCGPQPWPAEARKRAPQAAPESPTDLLCHSEQSESTNAASAEAASGLCFARRRKTNEVQSRIYNNRVTDSSSIFRSPQNDNAAFALNHFGLETHSSARPGPAARVALLARAGPGRKVKDLEMPITCTLFANSAADWNKQLATTREVEGKSVWGGYGL